MGRTCTRPADAGQWPGSATGERRNHRQTAGGDRAVTRVKAGCSARWRRDRRRWTSARRRDHLARGRLRDRRARQAASDTGAARARCPHRTGGPGWRRPAPDPHRRRSRPAGSPEIPRRGRNRLSPLAIPTGWTSPARAWPFWHRWQRIAFRWSRSKSPAGMGPWRCRATSSRAAASSAGAPRVDSLLRRTVWSGGQQQSRSLLPPRRRGGGPRSGGGCGRGAARTAIHRARTSRTWRSPPRKGDHACRVRRHAHRDRLRGSWPASLRHGSGRAGQDRDPDDR